MQGIGHVLIIYATCVFLTLAYVSRVKTNRRGLLSGFCVGYITSLGLFIIVIQCYEILHSFADAPPQSNFSQPKYPTALNKFKDCLIKNKKVESSYLNDVVREIERLSGSTLDNEVRLFCWVLTSLGNHEKKARHVRATWGRRCDKLIFVSDFEDPELGALNLTLVPGRSGLWWKTVAAFKYAYEHYRDDFDWFLKADDDTYIFPENVKHMVMPYSSNESHYFGFHFKPHVSGGYMSGGAGYVISRKSLDLLINEAFSNKSKHCNSDQSGGSEDLNLGKCLVESGVRQGDSRDRHGRNRFFPFVVETHAEPMGSLDTKWWYTDYIYWPGKGGLACCSNKPVSFHYMTPTQMYMLEYLAYQTRVYPVMHLVKAVPLTPPPPPQQRQQQQQQQQQQTKSDHPNSNATGKHA